MSRFPKPIVRQDGIKRATLKVEFVISRGDILDILAMSAWHSETVWGNSDTDLSKTDADNYIRDWYYMNGVADQDFVGDEKAELRAYEWAQRQVDRLYPEF